MNEKVEKVELSSKMDAAGDPLTDLQAFTSKRSSLRDKLKKRREALGTLLSQTSDSEQVSSGTKVEVEAVGGDGVQVGDEVAIGGAELTKSVEIAGFFCHSDFT